MILGLLADIHGNMEALELAWAAVSARADQIVCLGDVVEGGGQDEECVAYLRERDVMTVRGNHDDSWVALRARLGLEVNSQWLASRPLAAEVGGVRCVHDDPRRLDVVEPSEFGGNQIRTFAQALQVFNEAAIFKGVLVQKIVAIGHSHRPSAFCPREEIVLRPEIPVRLDPELPWILNPGTVGGTPRSAWGNTCGLLDLETLTLTILKLPVPKPRTMWDDFFEGMGREDRSKRKS